MAGALRRSGFAGSARCLSLAIVLLLAPSALAQESEPGGEPPDTAVGDDVTGEAATLREAVADGDVAIAADASGDAAEPTEPAVEPALPVDGLTGGDGKPYAIVAPEPDDGPAPALLPDLADDRPYDAEGVRIGSFRLMPSLESDVLYTDNVLNASQDMQADKALVLKPSLVIQSDWSRHALELSLAGLGSFHDRFASEDDRAVDALLKGRLDVLDATAIEAEAFYAMAQEQRGTLDFPTGAAERPDVVAHYVEVALRQRFNRLQARLAGRLGAEERDGAAEDFDERSIALRVGYELSPDLTVFTEGAADRRDFAAVAADGIARDSDGTTVRTGVSVTPSELLRGELSVGYRTETPDDDRLERIAGVVADGALEWRPSVLTTVSLRASSDIEPSSVAGAAGSLARGAGVEVRHELRRFLAMTAGVSLATTDYSGIEVEERELVGRLGVEYLLSRELALSAAYRHVEFATSAADGDYATNEVRVGLRVRR